MFISRIPFKDFLGIIHQTGKISMKVPRNKVIFLVTRILFGVEALLLLAGGVTQLSFRSIAFVIFSMWAVTPTFVITGFAYLYYGVTGYTREQVILLSKPKQKKLDCIKEKYGSKNIVQIKSRVVRGYVIKNTVILVHKPSKRQLEGVRRAYPGKRIWSGKRINKKRATAYAMVFTYTHYLVFFSGVPFSKHPYLIIDLNDERNSALWHRIKSDETYYKKLVTDNVRFQLNS